MTANVEPERHDGGWRASLWAGWIASGSQQPGIYELGSEVVMFHGPSKDSNLKTKGLALAASLQSNVFNLLKFGSPAWIRFELLLPSPHTFELS
jgi:hypothetical protein